MLNAEVEQEKEEDKNVVLVDKVLVDKVLEKDGEKELLVIFMKEMKETMVEMFKHMQPNNNTTMSHSHNNSHNKTFNLQFFLNEQCKDALNIDEFVSSIKIKLSDLEDTGRL
jgi:dsDNA-binding SOS-regulon protein